MTDEEILLNTVEKVIANGFDIVKFGKEYYLDPKASIKQVLHGSIIIL